MDNIKDLTKELKEISLGSDLDEFTKRKLQEEEIAIEQEHEKKIHTIKKNTIIFGVVGGLITLLSFGLYIIPEFFILQETKANIVKTEKEIDQIVLEKISDEETLKNLHTKEAQLKKNLGKIFPIILPEVGSDSEYQEAINRLAIFFEDFSIFYNKGSSPLELPSITFGKAKESEDGAMFILPIQMTIKASEKNFNLFIDQVNTRSGSIKEKDFYLSSFTKKKEPVPIMSINSLNISLPKTEKTSFDFLNPKKDKQEVNTLNFSVSLSAYFKATPYLQEKYGKKKK